MDEFPQNWELVSTDTSAGITTYRLRVPGGFLVIIRNTSNGNETSEFVAEPNHKWVIES